MNTAKPIFLVAIPFEIKEEIEKIQKMLEEKLIDYHVLIYMHNKNELEFKAIYDKDFDELKFEELKELINKQIKTLNKE